MDINAKFGGSYAGENDAINTTRTNTTCGLQEKFASGLIAINISITLSYLRGAFSDDDSFSFACLWLCIKLLWLPSASRVTVLAIHGSGSTMLLCVLDVDVESDATSLLQSDREQCTTCINYREH